MIRQKTRDESYVITFLARVDRGRAWVENDTTRGACLSICTVICIVCVSLCVCVFVLVCVRVIVSN